MMPTVQDDVRTLVEAVEVAPEVPEHQRNAVRGLAGELMSESSCINGLDLSVFAQIGLQLALSCERPDTPARTCTADNSGWFEEVGIRDRECRNEARETDHFEHVKQVGQRIGECSSAIEAIVRSADMAIRAILEPARRVFEIAQRCGITQIVEIAVEVIIEALRCATATTTDRNGVIRECLDSIAECTGEAAQTQPEPAVEKPCDTVASSSVGTVAAGVNISVDVGLKLGVELDLAQGEVECPPEEAPKPEPEPPAKPAPKPAPTPAPTPPPPPPPAPAPTPTKDGVIAPPPELSQVQEPPPPPKKAQHVDTTAASVGGADGAQPGAQGGQDPWAMKKTGEW